MSSKRTTNLYAFVTGDIFFYLGYYCIDASSEFSGQPFLHSSATNNDNDHRKKSVRLLCWVMTGPATHEARAIHVKATWGKRCDTLLFMSSKKGLSKKANAMSIKLFSSFVPDDNLPTIALPGIEDSRDYLWEKTKKAFQHVYDNYRNEADWYLKADDDTYVFIDNLKEFLSDKDPEDPTYYGAAVQIDGPSSAYMSGGAGEIFIRKLKNRTALHWFSVNLGYVLNRESLERFVLTALKDETGKLCRTKEASGDEDVEMGKCMKNAGVSLGDTLDEYGRPRFLPLSVEEHLNPGTSNRQRWYMQHSLNPKDVSNALVIHLRKLVMGTPGPKGSFRPFKLSFQSKFLESGCVPMPYTIYIYIHIKIRK